MNELASVALGGLLACISQQCMCQSTSSLDDDMRYAQLCAKATRDFRNQPEWKAVSEPRTFTSHFNKKLGKCLVKVTSTNLISVSGKDEVLEMQHVYDALEGSVLISKMTNKEVSRNGAEKTLGITLLKAGKILDKNSPDEALESFQRFETLMTE